MVAAAAVVVSGVTEVAAVAGVVVAAEEVCRKKTRFSPHACISYIGKKKEGGKKEKERGALGWQANRQAGGTAQQASIIRCRKGGDLDRGS